MDVVQHPPLIVDLPVAPLTREDAGKRFIYSQVSIENGRPDRQGEIIAIDALWASRDLFLEQGDLDIAHWAHMPNPLTGRPDLEMRIGIPTGVRRDANSIFIKGEIFAPTAEPDPDSSASRAELFWAALHRMRPAARYYPSIFGFIRDAEYLILDGQSVRRVTAVEWISVGFHNRVQHPDVPPVSLDPLGPFAKADGTALEPPDNVLNQLGGMRLTLGQLAKAMTVGLPVSTDPTQRTGISALARESLDKSERDLTHPPDEKITYLTTRLRLLRRIKSGQVKPDRAAIKAALLADGLDGDAAEKVTRRFLTDLGRTLHPGGKP